MTRVCTLCHTDKPLDEFASDPSGKFGVRSQCKECVNRRSSISGWRGPSGTIRRHQVNKVVMSDDLAY